MIPVFSYSNRAEWISAFVDRCLDAIILARIEGRGATLCLAGGTTPREPYEALSASLRSMPERDLPGITAFLGDERLEPTSASSLNSSMLDDAFGGLIHSGRMRLVSWELSAGASGACTIMGDELRTRLGPDLRFDLACLGLGADGHTAGLFERVERQAMETTAPRWTFTDACELAAEYRAPSAPQRRLSLGAGLLSRARKTVFLVESRGKDDAIARLHRLDPAISASAAASGDSLLHVLTQAGALDPTQSRG